MNQDRIKKYGRNKLVFTIKFVFQVRNFGTATISLPASPIYNQAELQQVISAINNFATPTCDTT